RLGKALDPPEDRVAEAEERGHVGSREGRAEGGARAEDPVPRPGGDETAHRLVRLELGQRGRWFLDQPFPYRVRRGRIEGNDREGLLAVHGHSFIRHRRSPRASPRPRPARKSRPRPPRWPPAGIHVFPAPTTSPSDPWRRTASWSPA